jgi:hypothetical protein
MVMISDVVAFLFVQLRLPRSYMHAQNWCTRDLALRGCSGRVRGWLVWSRGSHCGGPAVRRLGFCFCSPPRLGNMGDYSVMFSSKNKLLLLLL